MMIQKGLLGLAMLVALTASADARFCFDNHESLGGAKFHYTTDGNDLRDIPNIGIANSSTVYITP